MLGFSYNLNGFWKALLARALQRCHDRPAICLGRRMHIRLFPIDRQLRIRQWRRRDAVAVSGSYSLTVQCSELTRTPRRTDTHCIPPHIFASVFYRYCRPCHLRDSVTFAFIFPLSSRTPPHTRLGPFRESRIHDR